MTAEQSLDDALQDRVEESGIYDFYVYELRDPRNNEVFYVGKGQGPRIEAHGKDKKTTHYPKEQKIAEIKQSGHPDCLRVIVGSYETAEEAFAVEATLINWVYGLDNLTNISPGRHSWCIRPAVQHLQDPGASPFDYPHMDGIDRPKPVRSTDGSYTKGQKQAIEQNDIAAKLDWLTTEFQQRKADGAEDLEGITIIGPKFNRTQDPELVLSIDGTPVHAHLKLQLTGKMVSFNLRPTDTKRSSHAAFARHVTEVIAEPYDLTTKAGGVRDYVKAEPRGTKYCDIRYDDIDTILMVLKKAELRLMQAKHR